LRERVRTAARDTCRELDLRFPPSLYISDQSPSDCARNATRDAMAQLSGRIVARADTTSPLTR
jgi:hypothetical protein